MVKFIPFSERYGHVEVPDTLQLNEMSDELRNCLWNVIQPYIRHLIREIGQDNFIKSFFQNIIKQPFSKIPEYLTHQEKFIENKFLETKWYTVYSIIEFLSFRDTSFYFPPLPNVIINNINNVLKNENSGYRLIDKKIVPITSENEISEIQEALDNNSDSGVAEHLKTALKYLSDKTSKDYRNSVKESISAVEAYTRGITDKSTLGPALSKLESNGIIIPNVLKQGFEKIYCWTCGSDGIRHAIMEDAKPVDMAEAKFMLVACSAFINYLKMKQS